MMEDRKIQVVLSVFLAFVMSTGFLYHSVSQTPDDRKVAVIVLDGADFEILDRLKQQGELQNIQQLEEDGLSTTYRTPESFSPQTWTKMGTGMSTENISLERSWSYETETGQQRRLDSRALENRRFWSYLNEDGIETGVYHWVMTWPVEPVNGFMISGFLTANLDEMTYPQDIEISDEEAKSSLVLFNTFETAERITEEYYGMDVLVYGFAVSDRLQHSFWKFLGDEDPDNQEYRELMYRPYEEVDELVGELRPEYTVILVSDHGFERAWADTYRADINDLLEEIGLTSYKVDSNNLARNNEFGADATIAHRPGQNEVINRTHYRVRFEHLDQEKSPDSVIEMLDELRLEDGSRFLTDILYDDEHFEAVMHLDPDSMGEEYLDERYMRLSYARGTLPILQQELNVVYQGDTYRSRIGPKQTGDHPVNTHGVFYIAGEGIREEGRTEVEIKAEDLTPLILHLKGVSIPDDVDGEVPEEIFTSEQRFVNAPSYADKEVGRDEFKLEAERDRSQEDRIGDRLEDLGYLR